MRKLIPVLIASLALSTASAQPASQPATQPAEAYPALQRRLAALVKEVEALRAENARLRAERDAIAASAPKPAPTPPRRGLPRNNVELKRASVDGIQLGMTYDEVAATLGAHVDESRSGASIVRKFQATSEEFLVDDAGVLQHGDRTTVLCQFVDGKLVDIRSYDESARITAPSQGGFQIR